MLYTILTLKIRYAGNKILNLCLLLFCGMLRGIEEEQMSGVQPFYITLEKCTHAANFRRYSPSLLTAATCCRYSLPILAAANCCHYLLTKLAAATFCRYLLQLLAAATYLLEERWVIWIHMIV